MHNRRSLGMRMADWREQAARVPGTRVPRRGQAGQHFSPGITPHLTTPYSGERAGTVTLGVPINVHSLNFTASGYTFTGNVLTLGGFNPTITTNASLVTFNSALAGSNGLIKNGPGTLVLAADNAAFSGVTTAASGTLRVDHVNALGTSNAASNLRLNNGSSFYFNVDYAHDYTLTGGTANVQGGGGRTWSGSPTLTVSTMLNLNGTSGTLSGTLADTGPFVLSLSRNNIDRMTLSGNNTYTGATTVTKGFLQLGSTGALSSGSNLVFGGAAGTGGSIELTSASGDFTRSLGAGAGQVRWTGDGGFQSHGSDRTVNIGGAGATLTWGSGGFVPSGSRLILGTSSANTLDFQNGIDLSGGTRTIQAEGGLISGHARISGILSGTGALNLAGTGMLELTGANTYTGGTVLTSGTLVVGSDSNLGNTAGGVTFNGGTLENTNSFATARNITLNSGGGTFQTDADLEVSGPISGAGGLAKTGAANLTLTGSNTYTGDTTISRGVLQIGNGGTTGSIVGDVNNNSVLSFNRSDDSSYGGAISGIGGLNKEGGGRLVLTGENVYTGGTTIGAGTLQIGDGGTTGSIVGDVSNSSFLAFNRLDDISYAGVISGAGGLNKEGSGRLILTGESTYTGGTTIDAGTLQIGDSGTTGSIVGDVNNNSVLAFNRSDNIVYGGVISGSGALSNDGWGVLTLTGDNTYTGGTTNNAGVLQIGDGGTTGSIVGDVSNNSLLAFNRSDDISYGGVISGIGGLNKGGSGRLVLSAENAYTGGTTISAGTLQIGEGGTTGSIVGDVSNDSILTFNRSDDISYGGVISGIGGLNKEGSGRLVLTGENVYTGGTTIGAGALQIGNGGTTGHIVGDVNNNSILAFNRSDDISYGGVISGIGGLNKGGSGRLVLTGENVYTGTTTISTGVLQIGNGGTTGSIVGNVDNDGILTFNRSDDIGYSGIVSGTGALNKEGNGRLVLTGENAYTGGTTISAGTLQIGNGGTSGRIMGDVSNSGVLVFNRSDESSLGGAISGTGSIEQQGQGKVTLTGANTYTGGTTISAGTLQIGDGGTSGSIAGDVSNNGTLAFNRADGIGYSGIVSGTGGLNKQGSGRLVLTGENAYTGGTTINAGTLQIGNGGTTGSILGDVNNNGALAFNRSDDIGYSGVVSGTGGLNKDGSGRLVLTGENAYTGGTTISAGTLEIGNGGTTGSITGDVSNNGALVFNRSDDISYAGIVLGAGGLNKEGAGRLVLTGENAYTGGTTINRGMLQIGDGGTTGSIVGNVSNNGVLVFNRSDETSFGGAISGSGTIEQLGAGRVTLTGANTYTGGITISGGTLQIGDGGTTGSIAGNVTNNGVLAFNRTGETSFGGTISGTGSIEQRGAGRVTLTGENVYTGTTTISAGVLQIGNGGTTGSIIGNVDNGGILTFNRSDDIGYSGIVSGTGGLNKEGNGRLVLTGENAYTGGTTISAGTLQIGNGGASGRIMGDVSNSGVLVFNRSDESSLGGAISGTGSIEQQGQGKVTLTGANTYTGGTTISSGTLQIGDGGTSGSIAGDVSNIGTLAFNRTDDIGYSGIVSGTGGLNKEGSGRLLLTGENAYTGGTTINAGTLQIGNGGTTGSILGDVNNNGALAFNRSDDIGYSGVISGPG